MNMKIPKRKSLNKILLVYVQLETTMCFHSPAWQLLNTCEHDTNMEKVDDLLYSIVRSHQCKSGSSLI